jgi:hypothetical protein
VYDDVRARLFVEADDTVAVAQVVIGAAGHEDLAAAARGQSLD